MRKFKWIALLIASVVFSGADRLAHGQATLAPPTPKVEPAPRVEPAPKVERTLTELDRYVAEPDDSFAWKVVERRSDEQATELIVDLTSQTWRSADEVDRTVWKHWLSIVVPKTATANVALLVISGGSNTRPQPEAAPALVRQLALTTNSIVAEVTMIPNQPLVFTGDGRPRKEDDLLAYTWRQCLDTGDLRWPGQLPMVKSAVRAMDAVQAALAAEPELPQVKRFTVTGASKRGWTTWLTAAVDPRVVAIAPIVIDVLNVKPSMLNHHQAYNGWAPALDDYVREGLMERLGKPETEKLMAIVDPYAYRDRFTMPKCIINAAGDEFFTPDSSQFYYDDLPDEKLLAYFPNTGHGLKFSNAVDTIVAFHASIVQNLPRPKVTWQMTDDGQWRVHTSVTPRRATLWQAVNYDARDFRFNTLGPAYRATELQPGEGGDYVGGAAPPERGFAAYFIQLEFDVGATAPLRVSTPVRVISASASASGDGTSE